MNYSPLKLFKMNSLINRIYYYLGLCLFLNLLFSCQSFQKSAANSSSLVVDSVELRPVWVMDSLTKKNVGYRKVNFFTPLAYKNNIIIGNSTEGLSSFNQSSKQLNWARLIPYGVEAPGLIIEDQLFVGGLDGVFYSINLSNGEILWKFDTKSEIVAQAYFENGTVYFNNGSNSLFSLDAKTGRQNWVYTRQALNTQMSIRGSSKPVSSNGLIYSGFSDGSLVALNGKTGTQVWEVSLNKKSKFKDIDATPIIEGDQIYISSYDDHLYCLSKSNGSILWKYNSGGATAPLVVGQKIYLSTSSGEFLSFNKSNGEVLWKKKNISGIATEPVLFKGYVLFGESQGRLKALDLLSGEEKASFDPGKGIMSKPAIDENQKIYFISGESNFYQVELVNKTKGMIPYLIN